MKQPTMPTTWTSTTLAIRLTITAARAAFKMSPGVSDSKEQIDPDLQGSSDRDVQQSHDREAGRRFILLAHPYLNEGACEHDAECHERSGRENEPFLPDVESSSETSPPRRSRSQPAV